MPNIHETWTVLPHGHLTEIDEGILTVTGQIHMPLVDLQRRMTIVRLQDGSSIIYSAVALDNAEMQQIEALARRVISSCWATLIVSMQKYSNSAIRRFRSSHRLAH
jgi:hypothetical protein